jgi:uncharacterized membrane protein YeaQ/YmgE (transglycosylase-associated protein family)
LFHHYTETPPEGERVYLSNQRMITILLVGVAPGYLAGRAARGSGSGLAGDAAIGIVGTLSGNWLLPRFHIHLVGGLAGMFVDSAIGAAVLLLIVRLIGVSQWGGGRQSGAFHR